VDSTPREQIIQEIWDPTLAVPGGLKSPMAVYMAMAALPGKSAFELRPFGTRYGF
jgi:hypothetical protein